MQSEMYCQRLRPAIRLRYLKWKPGSLGCFCLILTGLLIPGMGYSQTVNYKGSSLPLSQFFKEIRRQTGYVASYNTADIKEAGNVKLPKGPYALTDILDKALTPLQLTYTIRSKTIFVSKTSKPLVPISVSKERGDIDITKPVIKINGRVIDENNAPLPGITVTIKNTTRGTATDGRGRFYFDNVPNDAIIAVQGIGYARREFTATAEMLIQLQAEVSGLDEIQVIAYGTTTKRLNTGSVATVSAKDIERQPVSNPLAALQGRVPGLIITQASGVAGAAFKVQIRGQSSLDLNLSQNNPLFVIDGVPFEAGNSIISQLTSAANNPVSISSGGLSAMNTINPQDIESIEVLKDADATSIYGSRGANGVVLITTKKGTSGKTSVMLNANAGISRPGRMMDMLNTDQYVQMRREAFANDGLTPSADSDSAGYAPDVMLWDTKRYTDFKTLLIGKPSKYNNFQGSISGGNSYTQFRIGGNYHRETSVYGGDFKDQIGSANISITNRSADNRFNLQFSAIYAHDQNKLPQFDLTQYINTPPNLLLYKANGELAWEDQGVVYNSLSGLINPLSYLNRRNEAKTENLSGNLNLSYKLLSHLTFKTNFGYNSINFNEHSIVPSTAIDPNFSTIQFPEAYFANSSNKSWIIEPQLNFNRNYSFGKIDILVGTTFQNKSGHSEYLYGGNYQSDLLLGSIRAAGTVSVKNDVSIYRYTAVFGRVNYNFLNKYLVNLTGRRDGSSRFGPNQQWANFGAIGFAWIFSEEAFLKDKKAVLSFGKLRGSYGTNGNDQIGDYKFLNLWSNNPYGYDGASGLAPSSLYNPDYKWEVSKKLEIALELGFLNNRILIFADYYRNRCSNQLINYLLPTQTGFSSVVQNFPGLVQNSGWEFSLNITNIKRNNFNWTTSFNISFPKNILVSFPGLASSSYSSKYIEGKSLTTLRAFRYKGMDSQKGIYTFEDANNDGQLTTASDYHVFENLDPKYTGGIQNNFSYKNFELSFFFQFNKQMGTDYRKQLSGTTPGSIANQPVIILDRWQKPGDNAAIQKLTSQFFSEAVTAYNHYVLSDGAYTDASYIKLRNVAASYQLPESWLGGNKKRGIKIYIQAQNLLTITKYKGSDPETQNFYALPPMRTIVGGIQFNL